MSRKDKIIFVLIVLLILFGAGLAYYLFNKGPMDVRNSSAVNIDAAALYEVFSKDSATALKKYAGKVLQVTGIVSSTTLNQQKEKVILLETNAGSGYVNCSMEEDPDNVNPPASITIKGICSGIGESDPELGILGDVYLTRCILIK